MGYRCFVLTQQYTVIRIGNRIDTDGHAVDGYPWQRQITDGNGYCSRQKTEEGQLNFLFSDRRCINGGGTWFGFRQKREDRIGFQSTERDGFVKINGNGGAEAEQNRTEDSEYRKNKTEDTAGGDTEDFSDLFAVCGGVGRRFGMMIGYVVGMFGSRFRCLIVSRIGAVGIFPDALGLFGFPRIFLVMHIFGKLGERCKERILGRFFVRFGVF